MKDLINKFFGGKRSSENAGAGDILGDLLDQLIHLSNLELAFDIHKDEATNDLIVDIYGKDEELLIEKEGQLLESIQLFAKRVLQHQLPDDRTNVTVDCGGFREKANQSLIDLAEKLKDIVVSKGKPVYFRALPPRDRKVVHQYLAGDTRVKSRSVGDGLYKKIKIYPSELENSNQL